MQYRCIADEDKPHVCIAEHRARKEVQEAIDRAERRDCARLFLQSVREHSAQLTRPRKASKG